MKKEEFIGIPRFNAKDEPDLTTQILMSISGWAYEKGLNVNEVMTHVGFVIQKASQDNPIDWCECGRKLVEGDEKDHD